MWTRCCRFVFGSILLLSVRFSSLASDVLIDTDRDGSPDVFEYFLHTDPNNADSVFGIRGVTALQSSSGTRLSWMGSAGRPYQIEGAPNPTGPWQVIVSFQ